MKIYLAAQFKDQELMQEWRRLLHNAGHIVTSRWLDHTIAVNEKDAQTKALIDLKDIDNSDVVISRTLTRGDLFTGGGRHIEFGYALAMGKILVNVGGIESVFHQLSEVNRVLTIQDAIRIIPTLTPMKFYNE